MDARLLIGLGISCIFGFIRWRFPTIPKPFATFGSVVGVGLLVWAYFPTFDWRWAMGLMAAVALTVSLLDSVLFRTIKPVVSTSPVITVDQRVTSHAQSGGITARNVRANNDNQ